MMQKRQLVVNSIYYTTGEVFPRIISVLLLPVLTKYLTPAEYGINSYTNTVMMFSFVFCSLSLNTYLLRNYYKEDTPEGRKAITGNIFILMLMVNGSVTILELLTFPFLIARLSIQVPFNPFFFLAIANNFLEGISIVPLVIYRVQEKARQFATVNMTRTFLQFILTYVLITRCHYGLLSVYMSRLFVNIIYTILFLVILYRNSLFRPDKELFRKALRFSLPLLPGALSYLFILSFDRIVLERNLGLNELGLYSSAATLSLTLNIIIQGLYRSFEQKIFKEHNSPYYERVTDMLYKYFLVCLLTGGFLLSIFSREVFILFTSRKFLDAYKLVGWLVVPVIISGLTTFLGTLLIADHRQKLITKATLISLLITFAGNLTLIKILGVYGAIWTMAASFFFVFFFYMRHVSLRNKYIPELLILLTILIAADLLLQGTSLSLAAAIALKMVFSALYFGLCLFLLRVRLSRI